MQDLKFTGMFQKKQQANWLVIFWPRGNSKNYADFSCLALRNK